jgi:hypothetical protein
MSLRFLSRPLSALLSRQYEPGDQATDVEHFKEPTDHASGGRRVTCPELDGNKGA